jgi:SagB-type dehydrogenase family enzyme
MKTKEYNKYLSTLSYEQDDLSLMENFHESTKFNPHSISIGMPRIISYMTEQRAMLETASNLKLYRYSPKIALPVPVKVDATLHDCLMKRSTSSGYTGQAVDLETLSTVLNGAIAPTRTMRLELEGDKKLHKRPYASGGGLYPIEIYPVIMGTADNDKCQVTHYNPIKHELAVIEEHSREEVLAPFNDINSRLADASVIFIITSVMERTTIKYGQRGYRFALIEAGEVAQNISLCAVANSMSSLPWGGYYDDKIASFLNVDNVNEMVVHVISIGYPAINGQ